MKRTDNKTFETIEQLRGAIIRRYAENKQAVVCISNKAAKKMPKNNIVYGEGVWEQWPKIVAIMSDERLLQFEAADDGEVIYFYDLE